MVDDKVTATAHVLRALRAGTDKTRWLEAVREGRVDADELAVSALVLGLGPLLHYQLEAWGAALPAPAAQAKVCFARRAEADRQAAVRAQLAEVLPRLPSSPIVLKGAYLAERVYPAPGLRPMNDIDLLFRPEDLPAAAQALLALGYGGREQRADQGPGLTKHTSTFKRAEAATATPNPYLSAGASRMIEPHRSLEESWFGLKCDLTPGMWERSVEIEIAGRQARALSAEDNLLHLAVHLAYHLIMGSPSFVQVADLGVFTAQVRVDWDAFLWRAGELRAAGYAYAALRLAVEVLAAPIPIRVLEALATSCPRRVRAAAEGLSLADILRRTQKPPLRTIAQRLMRGVEDRAETARWAHSLEEWLRVWGTMVDVGRTDTWRMMVRRRSKRET